MQEKDLVSISQKLLNQETKDFSTQDLWEFSKLIQAHGELYYSKESPIISDREYDELFKKYESVKKFFWEEIDILEKTGDFQQSSFKKVAHSRPMISLDNTYNAEELRDFDTRVKRITQEDKDLPYTIEFKFDGLWVEIIYIDGIYTQAITRGNGLEWEDVTENVRQITNIPKKIDKKWRFEVRWEVVMPISSFERLNKDALKNWEKVFANPRNAASGSLRVLDSSITKSRDLKYFAYDVSDLNLITQSWILSLPEEKGATRPVKYSDMIYYLESLGFEISTYFPQCRWIDMVITEVEQAEKIKDTIDFEIDGLVIKVNDLDLWWEIWSTEHHPRYAISYKFPAEINTTKILSIEHSVWRTGTITPVANVEPVELSGAIIRRSTLHNYDEIEKLDIREGDRVFIKRAGEVIPKIISVVTDVRDGSERQIKIPEFCPSCNSEVLKDEDKVRYYCGNTMSCPAQNKEQLAHSVWKNGLDIDGLWERQIEIFLEQGLISNLIDIFSLKNKREKILALEGFQEKSVDKLLKSIEDSRKMDIAKFLRSIWIPWVGKKTAKIIGEYISVASHSTTLSWILSLFEGKETADMEEELQELSDIGPEVARSLVEFFTQREEYVVWLLEILEVQILDSSLRSEWWKLWKYAWKKMCITGSFEWYSRDRLIEILEAEGWEFVGSVSKKTDYLLAGEKAGGKLKKATELGVEVLSVDEFLK